ncbi:hypothetical protein Anapl_03675, partial [Anas platyrhynchos]
KHCLQGQCHSTQMLWLHRTLLGTEDLAQEFSKHRSQTSITHSLTKHIMRATSVRGLHL